MNQTELYRVKYTNQIYTKLIRKKEIIGVGREVTRMHGKGTQTTGIHYVEEEISILTTPEIARKIEKDPRVKEIRIIPKKRYF